MSHGDTGDVQQRMARLEQQEERLTRARELLAQRDAAPAGKRRRDWDALAAVIASFIGFLALAVSAYTAYVQREQLRAQGEQLRAQVWPHLDLSYSTVDAGMGWSATNQGTGPAQVIAMRVVVDDRAVTTWGDVKKAAGYSPGEGITTSWIHQMVIPPGKEIAFVRPHDDDRSRARFKELLPGGAHVLEVTLCYCSVLEECWATGATPLRRSTVSGPRDSCPIKASERFEQ